MDRTNSIFRLFLDTGGSVLMESVVSAPLFMVMIGSVLWLGDLTYCAQRQAIAGRYAAFAGGNRHETASSRSLRRDVQEKFFTDTGNPNHSVERVTLGGSGRGPRSGSWASSVSAAVPVHTGMSVWTAGWFGFAGLSWDTAPVDEGTIHGRDGRSPKKFTVVTRTPQSKAPSFVYYLSGSELMNKAMLWRRLQESGLR